MKKGFLAAFMVMLMSEQVSAGSLFLRFTNRCVDLIASVAGTDFSKFKKPPSDKNYAEYLAVSMILAGRTTEFMDLYSHGAIDLNQMSQAALQRPNREMDDRLADIALFANNAPALEFILKNGGRLRTEGRYFSESYQNASPLVRKLVDDYRIVEAQLRRQERIQDLENLFEEALGRGDPYWLRQELIHHIRTKNRKEELAADLLREGMTKEFKRLVEDGGVDLNQMSAQSQLEFHLDKDDRPGDIAIQTNNLEALEFIIEHGGTFKMTGSAFREAYNRAAEPVRQLIDRQIEESEKRAKAKERLEADNLLLEILQDPQNSDYFVVSPKTNQLMDTYGTNRKEDLARMLITQGRLEDLKKLFETGGVNPNRHSTFVNIDSLDPLPNKLAEVAIAADQSECLEFVLSKGGVFDQKHEAVRKAIERSSPLVQNIVRDFLSARKTSEN